MNTEEIIKSLPKIIELTCEMFVTKILDSDQGSRELLGVDEYISSLGEEVYKDRVFILACGYLVSVFELFFTKDEVAAIFLEIMKNRFKGNDIVVNYSKIFEIYFLLLSSQKVGSNDASSEVIKSSRLSLEMVGLGTQNPFRITAYRSILSEIMIMCKEFLDGDDT